MEHPALNIQHKKDKRTCKNFLLKISKPFHHQLYPIQHSSFTLDKNRASVYFLLLFIWNKCKTKFREILLQKNMKKRNFPHIWQNIMFTYKQCTKILEYNIKELFFCGVVELCLKRTLKSFQTTQFHIVLKLWRKFAHSWCHDQ